MNGRLTAAAGCALLIRIACPAGAQVLAPPAAAAAQETPAFERTPPYDERAARRGTVLRLSAHEAVDQAVRHNLDIAIERYAREFALRRVVSARGYYDPA
ncbi:MAG: hypothetical protein Q7V01_08970, partial [Vicinamibacterales bacterium]|nr:hypothetical protein [Vicinamibacterales bacterium]